MHESGNVIKTLPLSKAQSVGTSCWFPNLNNESEKHAMEAQEPQGFGAVANRGSDTSSDQNARPLVNELRKAKLNAVKTLGAVCIAGGIPVEIQVLAAKTLLEFKLQTTRDNP